MRIQSASYLFASESLAVGRVPSGLRLNGAPIVDVAQFFRADFATVYGRGFGPFELTVSVWRFFSTEAAALSFQLTHASTIPQTADLTVVDDAATIALTMAGAVCSARVGPRLGLAVLVEYTFIGARFLSDAVPESPEGDTDTVKAINQALTAATVEQAVAYDLPFAAAPRGISLQLSAPDAGVMFGWQIRESSRTAAGFTVDFDAAVPAAGYKLTGIAVL